MRAAGAVSRVRDLQIGALQAIGGPVKKFLLGAVVAAAGWFLLVQPDGIVHDTVQPPRPAVDGSWRSGQQVRASAEVTRILSDDNQGSRHQRFIVRLESGRTLLIAHNIDLAPRVAGLRVGDTVSFNGQYEWNEQGGVIHWTHRDPSGHHVHGWIEHRGRRYE